MNRHRILDGLLASAGFASGLFLFLPLVVYLLNLDSVTTSKMTILLCGGLLAVVTTFILTAAMFLPRLGRLVVLTCQIGLIALVLLTVFPNRTGEMSGFVASLPSLQNLWAMSKLLAVCGAVAWIAWRKPQTLAQLSHYALVVILLVIGYVVVGRLSAADKAAQYQTASGQSAPSASFTQLGSSANVVVIIFDAFTGYRMTEVLNEDPLLRKELAGFVHYPAALASAISTPAGVSAILTGDLKISLKNEEWGTRNTESLKGSFLADAKRLGLTTGFISHLGSGDSDIPFRPETTFYNQQSLNLFNRLPAYLGFFTTSLPRIVPGIIASMAGKGSSFIIEGNQRAARTDWDLLQSVQSELDRRPQASKMALDYFISNLKVTKKTGSVIVLHSMLTHPPYKLTANGHYKHDKSNEYEGQSQYAVRELARLCAKLRALGVYDSTLLIAVADHGAMPIKDKTMGGIFNGPEVFPVDFNPLLMVKVPDAQGAFRSSGMNVWLGDVAATVRDFLGVSDKPDAMYATRSLLKPEISERELTVPVFFRPDQVNHYASLSQWARQDMIGNFSDYGAACSTKPEKMLETRANVVLSVGIDQRLMLVAKGGWNKVKGIPYRAGIEVNRRMVAKLSKPGIVVVSGSRSRYQTNIFSDSAAAEVFLQKIPSDIDRLVVGLQVPIDIAKRLFPEAVASSIVKSPVGFVAVSGPSYGPTPKAVVGYEDINLNFVWKP